jgi:hypothetical protein
MTDSLLLEEVTSPRKREFDANIKLAYPYNKVFNPVNLKFGSPMTKSCALLSFDRPYAFGKSVVNKYGSVCHYY